MSPQAVHVKIVKHLVWRERELLQPGASPGESSCVNSLCGFKCSTTACTCTSMCFGPEVQLLKSMHRYVLCCATLATDPIIQSMKAYAGQELVGMAAYMQCLTQPVLCNQAVGPLSGAGEGGRPHLIHGQLGDAVESGISQG